LRGTESKWGGDDGPGVRPGVEQQLPGDQKEEEETA